FEVRFVSAEPREVSVWLLQHDGDVRMDLAHDPRESLQHEARIGPLSNDRRPSGEARPFEIGRDQIAHFFGFTGNNIGQPPPASAGLVAQDRYWRLETMRQVPHLIA